MDSLVAKVYKDLLVLLEVLHLLQVMQEVKVILEV